MLDSEYIWEGQGLFLMFLRLAASVIVDPLFPLKTFGHCEPDGSALNLVASSVHRARWAVPTMHLLKTPTILFDIARHLQSGPDDHDSTGGVTSLLLT
jgi:hypothetical protein